MPRAAISDAMTAPRPLRSYDDLPGPRPWPVAGNLLQIDRRRMHQQFEAWAAQFGTPYRLRFGKRRLMVLADHALAAQILRDRPDGFLRTARLNEIWTELGFGVGLFGANGDTWWRQRRMVMAAFDPGHVKAYFPSLQRVAGNLAARWSHAAARGATIDLQADLMRYTVDTIAGLAFGADVNTLQSDADAIQQHLNRIFPAVSRRVLALVPTWRWFKSQDDRALEASVAAINVAVQNFIAQARARLRDDPARRALPSNLLEAMLVAADEPGSGIDDRQVAGNVLTMLLAGEDTTANTLAWMIHLLWRHPDALARAQAEVRACCAGMPTLDAMAQLDYLEACAHETMRMKPVAPMLFVQAARDCVVGDVRVPAGLLLALLLRHDGMSAQHVSEPEAFRPDRWLGDDSALPGNASAKRITMPFGAGPRICPGRYLALLEIKMAMAILLSRFDIVSVEAPGGAPCERLEFTMMPVGLGMRLRERAP